MHTMHVVTHECVLNSITSAKCSPQATPTKPCLRVKESSREHFLELQLQLSFSKHRERGGLCVQLRDNASPCGQQQLRRAQGPCSLSQLTGPLDQGFIPRTKQWQAAPTLSWRDTKASSASIPAQTASKVMVSVSCGGKRSNDVTALLPALTLGIHLLMGSPLPRTPCRGAERAARRAACADACPSSNSAGSSSPAVAVPRHDLLLSRPGPQRHRGQQH